MKKNILNWNKKIFLIIFFLFICVLASISTNIFQNKNQPLETHTLEQRKKKHQVLKTTESEQKKIAVHEAGHALFVLIYEFVHWKKNKTILSIFIEKIHLEKEGGRNDIFLSTDKAEDEYEKIHGNNDEKLKKWRLWNWLSLVGGHVAEEVFFGEGQDLNWEWCIGDKCDKIKAEEWESKNKKSFQQEAVKAKIDLNWAIKKATEIMKKPHYIKLVVLLAEALIVLKTLNRSDILYIFEKLNLKPWENKINDAKELPLYKEWEKNFKNKKWIEEQVAKSSIMEKLFLDLKKKILNFDIAPKTWTIKNKDYSFINLFEDRKKITIAATSKKSTKELEGLQLKIEKDEITVAELETAINKKFKEDRISAFLIGLIPPIAISIIIILGVIKIEKTRKQKLK